MARILRNRSYLPAKKPAPAAAPTPKSYGYDINQWRVGDTLVCRTSLAGMGMEIRNGEEVVYDGKVTGKDGKLQHYFRFHNGVRARMTDLQSRLAFERVR